jgi:hypothetical protein
MKTEIVTKKMLSNKKKIAPKNSRIKNLKTWFKDRKFRF